MSTMKKLFALTLALAMLMSGAAFAADFTDKTTINEDCLADVNLLTAIGIIEGNADGSFGPKNTIKRSEAAAMIYRLRNGGEDDKAEAWKGASSFTDVAKDIWYSGYVAYCENFGIIDGKSTTIFDPNAPVTTPELAKMLLTVAGYKSDVEGYTGSNWAKNVLADATDAGLFDSFGGSYAGACSREWACKMMVNAIETKTAAYLGDYLLPTNTDTVGEKYLDLGKETTIVIANDEYSIDYAYGDSRVKGVAPAAKDSIIVSTKTSRNENWKVTKTVKYDLPTEMVGQQVVIAYKATYDKDGKDQGVENAEKIYGVVPTGKTLKGELTIGKTTKDSKNYYTLTVGDTVMYKDILESEITAATGGYKVYGKFFGSDSSMGWDSDYMQYVVTAADTLRDGAVIPNQSWVWLNPWKTQKDYAGPDYTYTAYDMDGDGDLDRVIMTHSVYGVVDSIVKDSKGVAKDIVVEFVKATSFTDASKTYAIKDIEIVGAVSEGSVVKADIVDGKVVLTAVTKQTGVLEAVYSKGFADGGYNNLVIDGKKYNWAQTQDAFGAYSLVKSNEDDMTATIQENLIGKKVNFYLTTNGRMLAIPTLWTETSVTPDAPKDPETLDYSKLAYIIDANSYTVEVETPDDWEGVKTEEKTYNKIKYMTATGEVKVETYVDVTKKETKDNYLTFADLYDATNKVLKTNVAGSIVEVETSGAGVVFRKQLSKATKVIYGAGTAAGAVDAIGLKNEIALNEAKDRFGSYLTNDETVVFVKYVKTVSGKNETVYDVMKVSEFKELADGVKFNVIARNTGLISTALVASVEFSGDLPADKEEEVDPTAYLIYVTGTSVNTTFGTDKDGNAIQVSKFTAIDLNTGVEGTYYVKGLNKKVTVGDILEGELDADGYIATLPTAKTFTNAIPETLAKNTWYLGTLKDIVSGVMLMDDVLLDSSNFASKVTVYAAKTTNSKELTVSTLAEIEKVAKDKSDNVVFRTNSSGKINMVLFTADGYAF